MLLLFVGDLLSPVHLMFVSACRSLFSRTIEEPIRLGQGIERWNGFCQSIRHMSSTAFVRAVSLTDFLGEVLTRRDLIRSIHDLDYLKIKKALRGVRVEVAPRRGVQEISHRWLDKAV